MIYISNKQYIFQNSIKQNSTKHINNLPVIW